MKPDEIMAAIQGLIKREKEGSDALDWVPDDQRVHKLVDLMLKREKVMSLPEPPRGTISRYFFNPSEDSRETARALHDALPTLLDAWVKSRGMK